MVSEDDAQAALAAAQAEIVRLREAITTARVSISNGNPMKAAYVLEEELKGPAA
ncbi:hypothetical protein [Acetobacter malorum]|uniref:hypothetical protein n=1 Tax=Acetobacter malorum TaxID=178901 RepID=UPI00248E22BB|nr:hypothetical protein [Acetobacter malorum]